MQAVADGYGRLAPAARRGLAHLARTAGDFPTARHPGLGMPPPHVEGDIWCPCHPAHEKAPAPYHWCRGDRDRRSRLITKMGDAYPLKEVLTTCCEPIWAPSAYVSRTLLHRENAMPGKARIRAAIVALAVPALVLAGAPASASDGVTTINRCWLEHEDGSAYLYASVGVQNTEIVIP